MPGTDNLEEAVEAAAAEVEEGCRVVVSLARWYGSGDARARLVVWAARRRRAAWLVARLRLAVPLPPVPLALVHAPTGALLPPAEPLALLHHDDLLHVIEAPAGAWNELGLQVRTTDETDCPQREEHSGGGEGEAHALRDLKRRALELLDGVVPAPQADASLQPPTGPRRRRVRRRRPAAAAVAELPALQDAACARVVAERPCEPRAPRLVSADR